MHLFSAFDDATRTKYMRQARGRWLVVQENNFSHLFDESV